jgi:hypothetical protein
MVRNSIIAFFLVCACLCVHAVPAQTAVVSWLNLRQLYGGAATVFSGQCVTVDRAFDTRVRDEVITYTFRADRFFKGRERRTVSFKVHRIAAAYAGVPSFVRGERAVVFLYPESSLGVTSPVGLGQGKFSFLSISGKKDHVANERRNRFLFRGMRPGRYLPRIAARFGTAAAEALQSDSPGSIRYDVFSSLLEAFGRGGNQ